MILKEFIKRLDDLYTQAEENDAARKAAIEESERRALEVEGWKICARAWIYRGNSPLMKLQTIEQMDDYLSYLDDRIKEDLRIESDSPDETARLDEVQIARDFVKNYHGKTLTKEQVAENERLLDQIVNRAKGD